MGTRTATLRLIITATGAMTDSPKDEGPGGALLTLLTWFSPSFPIGAFAYSHGLEAAIREGAVRDAGGVADWIETLLRSGSGWNDLVLLSVAIRGGTQHEDLCELSAALSGSMERRAETLALGDAFARAVRPWAEIDPGLPYPISVARAAGQAGFRRSDVLTAYAHGFASGLVSAAVRLVPLGQSEATAVLRRLEPVVAEIAGLAVEAGLDDLGSRSLLSEIASMRHETLATRLFRS
jgi:urease accessory protein